MSCSQCQDTNEQGSAYCHHCGTALAEESIPGMSASQYPRTPGEQFLPDNRAGRYIPGSDVPPSQFRPGWRQLSRAEQTTAGATLTVLLSLFLPWFGFDELGANVSVSGTAAHGYLVIVVLLATLMAGYLLQRSGWKQFPFRLPIAPRTALIAVTVLQFLLVAIGFSDVPTAGLSWEFGAYLALAASAAALGAALLPVIRKRGAP